MARKAGPTNPKSSPFEHFRTTPCGVIRDGDWKLIEYFEDNSLELYNLSSDPGETKNLAESNTEQRDALHTKMLAWRKATKAPLPKAKALK